MAWEDRADELLRKLTGRDDAAFREGQLEAIGTVYADREKALVVQRTGWGKSAVYFIATALNRQDRRGPTLLVSPLLALMRNQIEAAEKLGLTARTVNSTNRDSWEETFTEIANGSIDLLLISPERLNNPRFRDEVLQDLLAETGLLVVDEAHCISDWGHDFRPDYRRISQVISYLPPGTPVLLTTATANDRVIGDVADQLGEGLRVIRGSLDRLSLRLGARVLHGRAERMAWLVESLPLFPGSGIVYTLTVRDAELVAGFLASEGFDAVAYTGRTDVDARLEVERRLIDDDVHVVVATSALGMGYDKPDLRWIIHFQSPGSPIAYYQQVGRAGRAVDESWGVLLSGHGDSEIQDFFIATAFPTEDQAREILSALEGAAEGLSTGELLNRVNLRPTRLEGFLKQLEVDGFIDRDSRRWFRTANPWVYPRDRVEGVTAQRNQEQAQMSAYLGLDSCRMEYLRRMLDDPEAAPCGRCDVCTGRQVPKPPSADVVRRAERYLGSLHPSIEPKKVWHTRRKLLPTEEWPAGLEVPGAEWLELPSHEPGVALNRWTSPLDGKLVRRGKEVDGRFDDELVKRLASLLVETGVAGRAAYVTFVPSADSDLVADLAERLARRLRLPLHSLLHAGPGPSQRTRENSPQQATNALGKLRPDGTPPPGLGLVVDDTVDSGWTLTVACSILRAGGADELYPVALADLSNG